jgi:protein-tyrosine-phosphatase
MLAADGEIADPIGANQEVYRACAERMRHAIAQRLSEIEV